MGGLAKLMPKTWWAMLVGGLALAGIPPLAGFFSKDAILASALDRGAYGYVLFVAGMVGTFLTGLYTFRMLFIVFGGEPSGYVREHPPHAHGDRVAQWSMYVTVASADRARGVRRLAPVRRPLERRCETGSTRSRRRSSRRAGRRRRSRASLAVLLGLAGIAVAWWIYSAHRAPAPKPSRVARAQVLLRRGVRRRLLPAGRPALARPLRRRRGPARRRLDHRRHRRRPLGRRPRPRAPDRPRPHVRVRPRRRARRPRPRLHGGQGEPLRDIPSTAGHAGSDPCHAETGTGR